MDTPKSITIFSGPVTAVIIVLLLISNVYFYVRSLTPTKAQEPVEEPAILGLFPRGFHTDEQAVFTFTGDTVLVQAPAKPINLKPAWNILYKDRYGVYQNEDVPEEMLDRVEPDIAEPVTK